MKTLRNIIFGVIAALAVFSCDNPIGLGNKLDLEGPEVYFTSPIPRKAVTASFLLEGTVTDKSGISMMSVKIEKDRAEMPRQWRNSGGKWEISDDYGTSWKAFPQGKWEGGNSVVWNIPVEMLFNGKDADDGQYMFIAQAWDSGYMSDDNSFKTLILIIDNNPPKVTVSKPLLYSRFLSFADGKFDKSSEEGSEIERLRDLTDWRNPEFIGKFQTNEFDLQWGIEDDFNIWAFDLRFYKMDVDIIDENPGTPLPDNYIYQVHKNLPPVPEAPSPSDYVKPNGTIRIPALEGQRNSGTTANGENWELKNPLTEKNTTIRVVAVCYDAANNPTQEKTVGFFIYWAEADIPWITFSGELNEPEFYNNYPATGDPGKFYSNVNEAFLIYPGVTIKAVSFHPQGVKDVKYTLWKIDELKTESLYAQTTRTIIEEKTIVNEQSSRGKFDWGFIPEPRSAIYVAEAETTSISGKKSDLSRVIFRVLDISFPDFPTPIEPPALEPLFMHVNNADKSITIKGNVADATAIDSLCLVWINPQSKGYASMSQLEYFRDADYAGWKMALGLTPTASNGGSANEGKYDPENPNKVWKLQLSTQPVVNEAGRTQYAFSKKILLSELNIGTGSSDQPLKSQVFLLRAQNQDRRTTIITYAPQGDEGPPVIKITGVKVTHKSDNPNTVTSLEPGKFSDQIPKFKVGDEIEINGDWEEDSVKYLDFNTYFRSSFKIVVNSKTLPAISNFTGISNSDKGTWSTKVTVASTGDTNLLLADLKDTLVISVSVQDIGKNEANDGASWLVESDSLRLVRISSSSADQTYKLNDEVDVFLEFNKPVILKNGGAPELTLRVGINTSVTAVYASGQAAQNTRQHFTYRVGAGQNTTSAYPWLDVTGLRDYNNANDWNTANYPFTWEATSGSGKEEIRITRNDAHVDGALAPDGKTIVRRLPVASVAADIQYTLAGGKNISIDTTAPTINSFNSSNRAGHYALNSEIIINAVFSEPVRINESNPPQLRLLVTNGGSTSVTTAGTPKVNNSTITFSYIVKANDTTGDAKVVVSAFTGGQITDIAGTPMTGMTADSGNLAMRTINGGTSNGGTGGFVH